MNIQLSNTALKEMRPLEVGVMDQTQITGKKLYSRNVSTYVRITLNALDLFIVKGIAYVVSGREAR